VFDTRAAVAIEPALNVAVFSETNDEVAVIEPPTSCPIVEEEISSCGNASKDVVACASAPHDVLDSNGEAPPPVAVEFITIVLEFEVVDRVMLVPAEIVLNLKSIPDFVSNKLSPVPKEEAVLASPPDTPQATPSELKTPLVNVAQPVAAPTRVSDEVAVMLPAVRFPILEEAD